MTVPKADLAAHVDDLVVRYRLTAGTHSTGGSARRHARRVDFRPVRSTVTYAVALHEIGHVVGRGQSRPRLESEGCAWEWAVLHALPAALGPRFEQTIRRSLRSYLRWACRRSGWTMHENIDGSVYVDLGTYPQPRPGCPTLPESGHVFWLLASTGRLDPIVTIS